MCELLQGLGGGFGYDVHQSWAILKVRTDTQPDAFCYLMYSGLGHDRRKEKDVYFLQSFTCWKPSTIAVFSPKV